MARTLIASDDFNRASLDSNWSQVNTALGGDVQIDSSLKIKGQYATQAGDEKATAKWVGAGTFTNDHYSSLLFLVDPSVGVLPTIRAGVTARTGTGTNGTKSFYEFYVVINGGETVLAKWVSGVQTVLHTGSVSWTSGDRIEIEVQGTEVRGCKNGAPLGGSWTVTDTSLATGLPGVMDAGNYLFCDDWQGGSVTAGSSITFSGTVGAQTGTVGIAFSWAGAALSTFYSSGTAPYTYSVVSGTLPAGLSLNASTGVISGTPTASTASTMVIRATDSAGSPTSASSNSFTITIAASGGGGSYSLTFGPGYYATGSGPQLDKTCYWSVYPGGTIGALAGITPVEGSSICDSVGIWTVTGITTPGTCLVLARDTDGAVFYDQCTAA